ncbi:unnamed protein product [marine sediment metagenome]|uniref:Twin-arginine translocation signal domain-containing protein n=1 Tax=marine sediment metagenome TaxID=412755 RepID=X0U6Z1_9ZZZZ
MPKKQTRREAIKKTGAAVGALAAGGLLTIDLEQLFAGQADDVKKLKLKIKVPKNLEVSTDIEKSSAKLPLEVRKTRGGSQSSTIKMSMDLTSSKTSKWLNMKLSGATSDCCTCCVRG